MYHTVKTHFETDLWIICVMYVLCSSYFRVSSLLPCCHLNGKGCLLGSVCDFYCDVVTFPFGIQGQVWYLIVSIFDLCCLSYFVFLLNHAWVGMKFSLKLVGSAFFILIRHGIC